MINQYFIYILYILSHSKMKLESFLNCTKYNILKRRNLRVKGEINRKNNKMQPG